MLSPSKSILCCPAGQSHNRHAALTMLTFDTVFPCAGLPLPPSHLPLLQRHINLTDVPVLLGASSLIGIQDGLSTS